MALNNIENRMFNFEKRTIELARKIRKINNIVNRMFNFEYRRIELRRKIKKIIHELDVHIEILEKEKMDALELFETYGGLSEGGELKKTVQELNILIASLENEKMEASELIVMYTY